MTLFIEILFTNAKGLWLENNEVGCLLYEGD